MKLTKVDELIRRDHYWLRADDSCFFLREYTAGAGYAHSDTNNLILNLKKKPDRRGLPDWKYKQSAIAQAAAEIREAIGDKWIQRVTLVPIPPSFVRDDARHDDRLSQVLAAAIRGVERADVRELLLETSNAEPAHEAAKRPNPDDMYNRYVLDENLASIPIDTGICLFDDVLTTGAHFVGAARRLSERFPGIPIVGVFVARRVPKEDPSASADPPIMAP